MRPPPTTAVTRNTRGGAEPCRTVKVYAPPLAPGVTVALRKRIGAPLNGAITRSADGGPPALPWVDAVHAAYSARWHSAHASDPAKSAAETLAVSAAGGAGGSGRKPVRCRCRTRTVATASRSSANGTANRIRERRPPGSARLGRIARAPARRGSVGRCFFLLKGVPRRHYIRKGRACGEKLDTGAAVSSDPRGAAPAEPFRRAVGLLPARGGGSGLVVRLVFKTSWGTQGIR